MEMLLSITSARNVTSNIQKEKAFFNTPFLEMPISLKRERKLILLL